MTPAKTAAFALCALLLHAIASPQPSIALTANAASVPQYGKIEFTLAMEPCRGNPFDPAQIDTMLQITAPGSEDLQLPCFYYQDYERGLPGSQEEQKDWLYPVGEAMWKARFAPTKVGRYSCQAVRRCRGETVRSDQLTFECTPSDSKGFLRVSERNPRYFEFSEGGACFLIGENLAFVKDTFRQEELLGKLGASGGNFARVWACCEDWGMSLQGRKSAWGRSWDWNPPIVREPGRSGFHSDRLCVRLHSDTNSRLHVSPSRPVPVRPDTSYTLTARIRTGEDASLAVHLGSAPIRDPVSSRKWTPFEARFRTKADQYWLGRLFLVLDGEGPAWVSNLSLHETGGGSELLEEADVNRDILSVVNLADAYMLDQVVEAAEKAGVYLQLVILPRDPYWEMHPCLKRGGRDGADYDAAIADARNLLRYAVARWGYSTSVAVWEYFNEIDPASPTDRFYDELGRYFEQVDIYHHPRATSAWGPSPKDWRHPRLDVINLHHYLRPIEGETWQDAVVGLFETVDEALAFEQQKPVLMAEFGLADVNWGVSADMKKDEQLAHLHNANWAAALSGLAGTVMPWWWDQLDAMGVYRLFPPLAAFVADIPYTTADLTPIRQLDADERVRVVGLSAGDAAYLWIADPQANWWNAVQGQEPEKVRDASVRIRGLQQGRYAVEWWDTRTGDVSCAKLIDHTAGALDLSVPAFTSEIACKVRKRR